MRTPAKAAAGSRARKSGSAFEDWMADYIFRPLKFSGAIARFDKLEPCMRSAKVGGKLVFLPIAGSGGDWLLLGKRGRYIVLECKSTRADRFYRSDIPAHQLEHLDLAARTGAGAFLAVRFEADQTPCFLVPWRCIEWERLRTADSIRPELLTQWRVGSWIEAEKIIAGY